MALFFYPVAKLQLKGAVEKIWEKDRLKITGGRKKIRILEEKKEYDRKEEPLTT